jgi:hypothetical protein
MHLTAQQVAWLGNGERGMSSAALFNSILERRLQGAQNL